jgi:hypothetical protein
MQAIRTRYINPTNTKGARIQAKCEARTVYLPYDHALNLEENHIAAREYLLILMGWPYYAPMVAGVFGSDYYHVFETKK